MAEVKIVGIEQEMKKAYLDYAMSVIVGRALPDVRDGLKPVQRRILYSMFEEGITSAKKHSKCAGVVGSVLKYYHPHGDAAVYDALVRLAQPWVVRYPLIDGQGNFGSIDGDPPAAYRYTECRLSKIGEELLVDIDKETVSFIPNFDETKNEPTIFPARIPNLLANGADGIAVGMATHIPPHNLSEVVDALCFLVKNPEASIADLMRFIKGPDFPTGGIIIGTEGIKQAYSTGKGLVKIRAKAEIVTEKKDTYIVITEIPYQENKARLLEKIAELVNQKVIDGISKIKDESDRSGLRIVIELKREATPQVVLNQLYKHTNLQTTYGIIMLALDDRAPTIFNLKQLLEKYLKHRKEILTRKAIYELRLARERLHILEGFLVLISNLDRAIQIIKSSEDPQTAELNLIKEFGLTDKQASHILELRLQKLTKLEREGILKEKEEIQAKIGDLEKLLRSPDYLNEKILEDLEDIKKKYGDKRRTLITNENGSFDVEELIEDEEVVILVTAKGYLKRVLLSEFRSQKRGGKGVTGASTFDDDYVSNIIHTTNLSSLFILSSNGKIYSLKAHQVPMGSRISRGRSIANLLSLSTAENVTTIISARNLEPNQYLFLCTASGLVKKMPLQEFEKIRKSGIVAINLKDSDYVVGGGIVTNQSDVILNTKSGLSIRFSSKQIRPTGRVAQGVKGMSLSGDDKVVGLIITDRDDKYVLSITEKGFGKRSPLNQYRVQRRGGKGIIDIKVTAKNGDVVSSFASEEDDEIILVSSAGKVARVKVKDIRVTSRNTQGVKVMDLEESEKVVACSLIYQTDE